MEIIGIFWRQQTLYNFFNLILSAGSFLKSVQYKQAADVILLLQPDRALCLDLLYGPARLHPPTWCWRETHSRSSTLLFLYLVRICIRDFVNHESVLSTEGALRLPTTYDNHPIPSVHPSIPTYSCVYSSYIPTTFWLHWGFGHHKLFIYCSRCSLI